MTHMKLKLAVAGLVLASAIGYLAYAGTEKGWVYTLSVDHYVAQSMVEQQQTRVRLCGTVEKENLEVQKGKLGANFTLRGESQSIRVVYAGIVPDLFQAGGEVLVEGKRDAAGVFRADVMMTKCASKYEEAPKGHPTKPKSAEPETGAQG